MKCWKIGLLVILGIAALGWVVMALWNWLIPTLFFGGKEIGYVQAMGVLLLSKILFGGFRHGGHGHWAVTGIGINIAGTDDAGRAREIPGRNAWILRQQDEDSALPKE
ncbi:MAG: hypothetical protein WDM70_08010 [Nitrosomonadales bacterium]